jgi:hypothetical protein
VVTVCSLTGRRVQSVSLHRDGPFLLKCGAHFSLHEIVISFLNLRLVQTVAAILVHEEFSSHRDEDEMWQWSWMWSAAVLAPATQKRTPAGCWKGMFGLGFIPFVNILWRHEIVQKRSRTKWNRTFKERDLNTAVVSRLLTCSNFI